MINKLYKIGEYEKKDSKGKPMVVAIAARRTPAPRLCKTCRTEPRAGTSSRCAECLKTYKIQSYNNERLRLKVEQAQGIKLKM